MRIGFLVATFAISTPAAADVTAEATAVHSILQRESVNGREDRYTTAAGGLVVSSLVVGLGLELGRDKYDEHAGTTGEILIVGGAVGAVFSTYLLLSDSPADERLQRFDERVARDPTGSVREAREVIARRAARSERNGMILRIIGFSILGAGAIGTTIAIARDRDDVALGLGLGTATWGSSFAVAGYVPNSDERTHAKLLAVKGGGGVALGGSF